MRSLPFSAIPLERREGDDSGVGGIGATHICASTATVVTAGNGGGITEFVNPSLPPGASGENRTRIYSVEGCRWAIQLLMLAQSGAGDRIGVPLYRLRS